MRHRVRGKILKREKAPREALVRSLARSLLLKEAIQTTLPKAKVVQSFAERLITVGKQKSRHARTKLMIAMHDEKVVDKVIDTYAVRFATREGGYTRLRKIGPRQGDGAPMAYISLLSK